MDKRNNTEFNLLTVSETAIEPSTEDENSLNSPRKPGHRSNLHQPQLEPVGVNEER